MAEVASSDQTMAAAGTRCGLPCVSLALFMQPRSGGVFLCRPGSTPLACRGYMYQPHKGKNALAAKAARGWSSTTPGQPLDLALKKESGLRTALTGLHKNALSPNYPGDDHAAI